MNDGIAVTHRRRLPWSAREAIWVILLLALAPITGWCQSAPELLRQTVENAHDSGELEIAGSQLIAVDFLARFYEGRRFELVWTDPSNVETVLHALATSGQHGLSPDDFHVEAIRLLREQKTKQPNDALISTDLDLLLTDGMVAYVYQLVYGKVDPAALTASWNLKRPLLKHAPEDVLQDALSVGSLAELLKSLAPSFPYYQHMQDQLESYRQIANAGGWPSVPTGPTLKPGDIDPRMAAVRARLAAEFGDKPAASTNENAFDAALEQSVRRFQKHYALDVDGAVGPKTLRIMNITAAQRVDQIRVNMERARWVREEATEAEDFVHVNIAGFYVRHFEDRASTWETRAIVGAKYHKTPIFAAHMEYIVFNPTWTVPRSIIRKEMLPKMKADPGYLPSRNFDLVDRSGRKVDLASVDWAKVSANNFPYNVVQRPGPRNALGQVKFIFPNSHSVYLHDTPGRQLFDRSERTFSHGCIRTKNPLDLAERLLADQPKWTRQAIDRTIEGGKTTTVHLTKPLRVLLLYWTAEPDEEGGVRFYEDAYDRDPAVLAALDSPFRPDKKAVVATE
jgi:murein L,D-transpeptidase YcbB/YkuD